MTTNEIVKVGSAGGLAGIVTMVPTLAFATDSTVSVSDFQGVLTGMSSQISVSTIVAVLTAGVAASIGLVFMWWGVRKLTAMLFGALRKGKESV